MNILTESMLSSLEKLVDFRTRSSRSEYWYATLGWIICTAVLSIFSGIISAVIDIDLITSLLVAGNLAFYAVLCVASVSLGVRRLHDIGITGWLYLINLTGLGSIALTAMFCMEGQAEPNKWGANPKNI